MSEADKSIQAYDAVVFKFPFASNLSALAFYAAVDCEDASRDSSLPLWARNEYSEKSKFFYSQIY